MRGFSGLTTDWYKGFPNRLPKGKLHIPHQIWCTVTHSSLLESQSRTQTLLWICISTYLHSSPMQFHSYVSLSGSSRGLFVRCREGRKCWRYRSLLWSSTRYFPSPRPLLSLSPIPGSIKLQESFVRNSLVSERTPTPVLTHLTFTCALVHVHGVGEMGQGK